MMAPTRPRGRPTTEVQVPTHAEQALAAYSEAIGQPPATGEWLEITQERINGFADVTEDHQFIHVDPEACAEHSPWGVPIAHGFLTLSLVTALVGSVPQDPRLTEGRLIGINYGFDRVRFLAPVTVGSRVRAAAAVAAVVQKDPSTLQVTQSVTVQVEGGTKPALACEWITRSVYA
jgi:acyl dehydratase